MNLGMTGTRNGATQAQQKTFTELLAKLASEAKFDPFTFRHGSCMGADVEGARLVRLVFGERAKIISHPGLEDDPCRTVSGVDDETLPGKGHFARNRDIVNLTDCLVAFPPTKPLPTKGGTAFTVNFAMNKGKLVRVIWPDGTVEVFAP